MSTLTAWRFTGTERTDDAVLRLSTMVETIKGDITPEASALVLLSSAAALGAVVKASDGQGMELIRSNLSVPQQDQVRAAFSNSAGVHPDRSPGNAPEGKG